MVKTTNNMPTTNTNTNAKTDWKKNELGVLWKRQSKSGEKYLTGSLTVPANAKPGDVIQVICFSNKTKKAENHPDLRLYISEKNGGGATASAPKPVVKTAPKVVEPEPEEQASGDGELL